VAGADDGDLDTNVQPISKEAKSILWVCKTYIFANWERKFYTP